MKALRQTFVVLILATGLLGQEIDLVEGIRACSEIKDDAARLAAYDRLAQRVLGRKGGSRQVGKWKVERSVSPMDDREVVTMRLDAESEISGWPSKTYRPTLLLRFKEGSLDAYIVTGMPPNVESGDRVTVTLRFDKLPAETAKMSKSTDGEALFIRRPKEFIERLLLAKRLIVRFTPFNSSPAITTFDLTGLNESIKPLLKASGWKPSGRSLERIQAEKKLQEAFGSSLMMMNFRAKGLSLRAKTEGNRWKPYFRDDAVVDLTKDALKAIQEALADFDGWRLRIDVQGTTYRKKKSRDGGAPFSSEELAALVRRGVKASGATNVTIVVGKDREPEIYGDDAPEILRGDVRTTGENFTVTVLGIR